MDQLYNYVQVATNCSQYTPINSTMSDSMTSSTTNGSTSNCSCLSCQNFENHHCRLDLYDKINKNLSKHSSEL